MLAMGVEQSLKDGLIRQPVQVDGLFWESVRGT